MRISFQVLWCWVVWPSHSCAKFQFFTWKVEGSKSSEKGTWAQSNVRGGMRKNAQFFRSRKEKVCWKIWPSDARRWRVRGPRQRLGGCALWVREGNLVGGCGEKVVQIRSDVVNWGEGGKKAEKRGQEPVGCHLFFSIISCLIFQSKHVFIWCFFQLLEERECSRSGGASFRIASWF